MCSPDCFDLDGENTQIKNSINGFEYVDLGLPSGTLWATCNVGAFSPSDYGNYFAWGETCPKSEYHCANFKYCDVDNIARLEMFDDAARVNWGGNWRMPTKDEWSELKNNCAWQWTSLGGHNGYKITNNENNNSIFLPAAGWRYGSSLRDAGEEGNYWSSSLDSEYPNLAYSCCLYSSYIDSSYWGQLYYGRSVRPVTSSAQN